MEHNNGQSIQEVAQKNPPSNLEEALKRLREGEHVSPQADVDDKGMAEGDGDSGTRDNTGSGSQLAAEQEEGGSGEPQPSSQGNDQEPGSDATGDQREYDQDGGGSATAGGDDAQHVESQELGYQPNDYTDTMKNLAQSVARQAAMDTNSDFQKQGIRKLSIGDLYQQDPNSGRVSFSNPDDPDHPFASRQEAQAWVNAFNEQYDAQWKEYATNLQRKYMEDTAPAMRLMQFAPVYEQMDKKTQQVFDTIVEPYSVNDSTGMLIGFSCDLNAAKVQAEKLAGIFGANAASPAGEPPIQPAASGPALDAVTHGSEGSNNPEDPKDLQEAFKLLNKQRKEGTKNGK